MRNKNIIFAVIFGAIIAVCTAVIIFLNNTGSGTRRANIYINGELYRTVELPDGDESYTVDIETAEGGHNTVLVEKDGISMYSADCPDKLCVKRGKIKNGVYPIVCLPHKVVLTMDEEGRADASSG